MGLVKPPRYRDAGALLPHRFSFSPRIARGVFFSVTLSVGSPRPAVSRHPALRSPDFPHHHAPPCEGAGAAIVQPAFARLIIAYAIGRSGNEGSARRRSTGSVARGQVICPLATLETLGLQSGRIDEEWGCHFGVPGFRNGKMTSPFLIPVKYPRSPSQEARTSCDDSSRHVRR